jgi:hypothetical protein
MKKENKTISYVGKEVFIGIEIHKKTYDVVARVEGEIVKRWTTAASPQTLVQQLGMVQKRSCDHFVFRATAKQTLSFRATVMRSPSTAFCDRLLRNRALAKRLLGVGFVRSHRELKLW